MKHLSLAVSLLSALTLAACTAPGNGEQSSSASSSSTISSSSSSSSSAGQDLITVASPLPNAVVSSPLTVTGEARGTWYFEASFPVKLLDANGNQLAIAPAQAQGEWMTVDYVPFSVTLTFATPTTATGTLILEKDNPSGLPEHADFITVPVEF